MPATSFCLNGGVLDPLFWNQMYVKIVIVWYVAEQMISETESYKVMINAST